MNEFIGVGNVARILVGKKPETKKSESMKPQTWKLLRSGTGTRTPTRDLFCSECGSELVKYRFEQADVGTADRLRVCPLCVLLAYLNQDTFWNKLKRLFKPKHNRESIVLLETQKGKSDETVEVQATDFCKMALLGMAQTGVKLSEIQTQQGEE